MQITSKSTEFPYLHRGIIKDNCDPKGLGRCRVYIPDVHGEIKGDLIEVFPWARPISTDGRLPELDEIVWILFEAGQKNNPVYFRGVITTNSKIQADRDLEVLYERDSCKVYYDRINFQLILQNESSKIVLDPLYIDLESDEVLVNGEDIGTGGSGGGIWYYDIVKEV